MAVVNRDDGFEAITSGDYKRQLSDEQLVDFARAIDARTNALLAQGIPLPLFQIENHHVIGLLEAMVGKARSLRVREWHLSWVDRRLDDLEAELRARVITTLDTMGEAGRLPGGPNFDPDLPGFPA